MADEFMKPGQFFTTHVPPGFLKALFDLLNREYPKARRECEHLPDPQARYLRPHVRRANIEAGLLDIAGRFPGVEAKAVPNAADECHVEVTIGCIRMTVSHADQPNRLIREAKFRRTLAEDSQLRLAFEQASPSQWLYALLLHGGSSDSHTPAFADIVFPIESPDIEGGIGYASDRIHLVKMFGESKQPRRDEGDEPDIRKEPDVG